jgi:hypothetical protein
VTRRHKIWFGVALGYIALCCGLVLLMIEEL